MSEAEMRRTIKRMGAAYVAACSVVPYSTLQRFMKGGKAREETLFKIGNAILKARKREVGNKERNKVEQ